MVGTSSTMPWWSSRPRKPRGLAHRLAATTDRSVGVSAATSYPTLGAGVRQATQAAAPGHRAGARVVHYDELAMTGVIGLLDPAQAQGFAEALLSGLIDHDRQHNSRLVLSLRTWLADHGQWDPAAEALGVHRHTLRKRIATAEGILGRDLSDPETAANSGSPSPSRTTDRAPPS